MLYALLGDSLATHRLLLSHSEAVHAYIEAHLPGDVRDKLPRDFLLFQIYAKASASLKYLQAADNDFFNRWLLSITREVLIAQTNACRKGKQVNTCIPAPVNKPSSVSVVRRTKLSRLACAIDKMPSDIKAVITMRYYRGMPDADIAQALGIPGDQVVVLCNRGIEQLKGDLGSAVFMLTST